MTNVMYLKRPTVGAIPPVSPKSRKRPETPAEAEAREKRKQEKKQMFDLVVNINRTHSDLMERDPLPSAGQFWSYLQKSRPDWATYSLDRINELFPKLIELRDAAPAEIVDAWKKEEDYWARLADEACD